MTTKSRRRQFWRGIAVYLPFYYVVFFSTFRYVRHHHPQGVVLYLCAALPWIMMCGFIASIGLYLYKERDGYAREIAMRCMLWGAAGAMATNFFLMFLHMFGWRGRAFPPLEIFMFAAAAGVARIFYERGNCPERDLKDGAQ